MNKKSWLVVFIISVLALGVAVAYMVGLRPGDLKADINSTPATLAFSPASSQISMTEPTTINISLDTGGAAIDGVDLYINYDPTYLEIQDSNSGVTGVQIKPGTLFPTYLANQVDTEKGKITLSGIITPGGAGYSGSGTFASIVVKGLRESTGTRLTFDYVRENTTDTNVIEHGTGLDILASVTNGAYSVGSASAPTAPKPINGTNPDTSNNSQGSVLAAKTGTVVSIALVVLLIALAIASLIFLLRKNNPGSGSPTPPAQP